MPEQIPDDTVATVFINDLERGERQEFLEAGDVIDVTSDGPVSIQVEAHPPDNDD